LLNIHELLAADVPGAKNELARHCPESTLTPEEKRFTLSDEWVLLGDLRSDGAGGPDRTVRSFEFLLPVPA
jgi:hypothetical protein